MALTTDISCEQQLVVRALSGWEWRRRYYLLEPTVVPLSPVSPTTIPLSDTRRFALTTPFQLIHAIINARGEN